MQSVDSNIPQNKTNDSADSNDIRRVLDLRPDGLRFKALPHDFDRQVSAAIRHCMILSTQDRLRLTNSLTDRQGGTLFTFASRMASLGLNERSADRIAEGLDALALEGCRYDYRETILILSTLRHSLIRLGHDPEPFVDDVMSRIDGEAQPELKSSLRNKGTIAEMCIEEVKDAKGRRYRQNG